ncbi:MAG: hypothetical protein EOO68_05015 [Moraxellaceae bacterium]|nr:MAG: hypothetical protein EOO68_05015 [Moraxellaceae bacterium]
MITTLLKCVDPICHTLLVGLNALLTTTNSGIFKLSNAIFNAMKNRTEFKQNAFGDAHLQRIGKKINVSNRKDVLIKQTNLFDNVVFAT